MGTYAQVVLVNISKTRLENNDNYYRRVSWNRNNNYDDIDKEIDRRQAEKAKEAENLIIEGRLSAYFVENADLRLWLVTPFDVRSQRISHREGKSVEVAKNEIITRENSEALRYMDIHNIDITNMDIYDLIINTGTFDPKSVSEIIIQTLKVI